LDRLEEAIVAYRQGIELNPEFSESHNKLGDALAKVGRSDEASVCYRRALELKGKVS
jgi:Flp pilus assembly protein TadD